MDDCIFCKIVKKEIPANIVFEDDKILVFEDIKPQAKVHLLVIPKKHISSIAHLQDEHKELVGHLILKTSEMAKDKGIEDSGYRLIANCGAHGGQEVFHVHWHILGGEPLGRMLCK